MTIRHVVPLVVLAVTAIAGCLTDPLPVFDVTFHEDSVEVYDFSYCDPPELYCQRPTASSNVFAGVLDAGKKTLVIGKNTYAATGEVSLDSSRIEFVYTEYPCGRYSLRAVRTAAGLRGTWSAQYDCHGLSGIGHLESP